jgi:anti-sigma regulatory factor (Ser/Thr protein kinase)
MHVEFEPHVERIGEIRRAVRDELAGRCSDDLRERIELVLSELLTNAVRAAPLDSVITADVSYENGRSVICVHNISRPSNPPVPDPPSAVDPASPRGRGLLIASRLTSALDIDERDTHVTVTAMIDGTGP